MTIIGFLACETTIPGAEQRRVDAFEHDLMVDAIEPALAACDIALRVVDWEADLSAFDGLNLVLLGSSWNYQDKHAAFLERLETLARRGIVVCNPPQLVRWNSRKTYLRELAESGAATIPTIWEEDPSSAELASALAQFGCDQLVVKRQIGAGAEGQVLFAKGELPPQDWRYGHPAMLQPFLPAILEEGEFSMIFIDGEFSHALRKVAAKGDYRIQTMYGGSEQDYSPTPAEIATARSILSALPQETPLYARIDMVRAQDGGLMLMEAELIEPYLYPIQGPQLGEHLARAIAKRLKL